MITRIIVYSILLCLIILTAYVRGTKHSAEKIYADIKEQNAGPVISLVPSSSSLNNHPSPPPEPSELPALMADNYEQVQHPRENEERARSGIVKLREGDYAGAAKIFAELSEHDKGALSAAGLSYFRLGDFEKALSFLEKAVVDNGNDFVARKSLAVIYYKTNNLEKSLENTVAALSLQSDAELKTLHAKITRDMQAQGNYNEESSSHFKVFFDGYEHGKVNREITGILEDAYRAVGRELDYFPSEMIQVILYTGKNFFDVTQTPSWTAGCYDGKIRVPIRGADRQGPLLKKVLFHEYTHALVRSITQSCPLWINEGLAEYFSTNYPRKIGQAIPLRNLERSFSGLGGRDVGIAYMESYSAVSYLIDKYGLYRTKQLLLSLSKGADINQAFRDSFGITYDEFVSKWN